MLSGSRKPAWRRKSASRISRASPAAAARSCARAVYSGACGVADHPAEPAQLSECLEDDVVVVGLVGERECSASAIDSRREPLPEACRLGEADLDARVKRRLRRGVACGFLEERDGKVIVVKLGENEQRLGAQRTVGRLGQQLGDRSCARPLPGGEVRTRSGERAPCALVLWFRRRQPECVLRKLGRERRCAAIARRRSGALEQTGDSGVGLDGREREVTSAEDGVVDDLARCA